MSLVFITIAWNRNQLHRLRIGPIVEKGKQVYGTAVEKFMSKKDQAAAATADAGERLTNGTY